jgi:hypothetical protein
VRVDSDFNARGYKFTTGGIDLGIDYRLTDHLAFGLMGSYAHTWTDLRPGSIDVDSAGGGIYASYFNSCFYLNGGIYGGYNSYDSSRPGLQGNANGNSDGGEFSTFVSGGYDFHFGHLTAGPIASILYGVFIVALVMDVALWLSAFDLIVRRGQAVFVLGLVTLLAFAAVEFLFFIGSCRGKVGTNEALPQWERHVFFGWPDAAELEQVFSR